MRMPTSRQRSGVGPGRTRRSRGLTAATALVLAVLTAVSLVGCGNSGMAPTPHGEVVAPEDRPAAPAFEGVLLDGDPFTSDSVAGRVVVLNFWGSWCGPCRVEVPALQSLHGTLPTDRVAVLGVNLRDQRRLAQAFLDDRGVTYPSLFDPRGEVVTAFADQPITLTPASVLIDSEGRVAAVYLGGVRHDDLDRAIGLLLDETP